MPQKPGRIVHFQVLDIFRYIGRMAYRATAAITCVVWTAYVDYVNDFGDEGEVDFSGGNFGGRVAQMIIPHLTALLTVTYMDCYEEHRGPQTHP